MPDIKERYAFVDKPGDDKWTAIRIQGGKFDGVVYHYAKVYMPDDIEEVSFAISESSIPLANLLKDCGMTSSTSEAIRMIKQGAVRIDEKKIIDTKHLISSGTSAIYQVGKRKFKKITL